MTDHADRAFRLLLPDSPDGRISQRDVGLLAGLFDEVDLGLVTVHSDSDFAYVNDAAAELLNIAAGDTSAARFGDVIADLAARALNRSAVTGALNSVNDDPAAAFQSTWEFADHPTHLGVMSKPAPYPGFNGRIWAFYDNSPIAEAIGTAKDANALLRATADAMMDPHVVLEVTRSGGSTDLVYRDANEAACAYFGVSREELIGRLLHESPLKDRYVTCAETGEPVVLDAFPFRDDKHGPPLYYDVRAVRVLGNLVLITWRDVSERMESARRIAASEEQFRLLADNVADVVVRLDDDGTITWISKSVEPVLGAAADRWLGQRVFDLGPATSREPGAARWRQLVAAGTYIGRETVYAADGTHHTIHLHAKPFYDADGERNGVVASFRVIDDEVAAGNAARKQIALRDERNRKLTKYLQSQANRLRSQLNSAARYVASILPQDLDGPVRVTSRYLPSEELSGDSYDFRWIDDDHLLCYLVDVSGHGVEPALLSVSVHNVLRSGTIDRATLLNPGLVLAELNRTFQMDRQGGLYFTIWYGVYRASTQTLRFASAGHPPTLVAEGPAREQLSTDSIPIGVQQSTDFETRTYAVAPGAELLLYSDGALELGLPEDVHRSVDDLQEIYARVAQRPDWTLDALIAELQGWPALEFCPDDCTFVRLSFPGQPRSAQKPQ